MKAVSAINSMRLYLDTRNPNVKTIKVMLDSCKDLFFPNLHGAAGS